MKNLINSLVLAASLVLASGTASAELDYIAGSYAAQDAKEWANSHGMQGATVIGCKYLSNKGSVVRCVLAKKLDQYTTDTVQLHCNGNVKVGNKCTQVSFQRFHLG